jgi:hypothetical protein
MEDVKRMLELKHKVSIVIIIRVKYFYPDPVSSGRFFRILAYSERFAAPRLSRSEGSGFSFCGLDLQVTKLNF